MSYLITFISKNDGCSRDALIFEKNKEALIKHYGKRLIKIKHIFKNGSIFKKFDNQRRFKKINEFVN